MTCLETPSISLDILGVSSWSSLDIKSVKHRKKQVSHHVENTSSDGALSLLTLHVLEKCALLIALSLMMERSAAPAPTHQTSDTG